MDSKQPDDRTVMQPAPSAAPPLEGGHALPAGTRLGEFELRSRLGEGGFGIVYLATDHSLQRPVALKEYMPSALAVRDGQSQVHVRSERQRETFEAGRRSFVNEARLLARFDHPSLVKVYRFWEANGTAYMAMPFYEGRTLKDTLQERSTPPDEAWLRGLLAPLLDALETIHAEQCYHRDIAPDNIILLAGSLRPLLLDFGAARRVIGDMTQALTVILKPGYAPLEQYAEIPGMKQGPWTDLYALAGVVYFAITGSIPPPAVSRLVEDGYRPLVQRAAGRCSERFLRAIDHAMALRPEQRPQSVAEFRAELSLVPPASQGATSGGVAPGRTRVLRSAAPVRTVPAAAPSVAPPAVAQAPQTPGPVVGQRALGLGAAAALALLVAGGSFWFGRAPPAAPAASAPAPLPANAVEPRAAAPVVPVAKVTAVLDPGAEFERIVQAQTAGFGVDARPARSSFRIGKDALAFNVRSDRDGYLYVLLHGPDGSLMLLYPNQKSGPNRIRGQQTLALPAADWALETSEPPGPEHFLVLVSSRPRTFSDLSPRPDGWFQQLATGAEAAAVVRNTASPVSALAGRPRCEGAEPCADEFGATAFKVEVVR